jgi:hypothetical protein
MKDILTDLNKFAGVKGSMVVTADGMVVASALGPDLENENVAAISSQMIGAISRSLGGLGVESFSRYILSATHGRIVFVNLGVAYLVVITHQNIKLDVILIEIASTAYKITHRRAS